MRSSKYEQMQKTGVEKERLSGIISCIAYHGERFETLEIIQTRRLSE